MPVVNRRPPEPVVVRNAPSIKITAAYGRLYVSGSHKHLLSRLPGATKHERTESIMMSLTLDSLRAIRRTLGVSQQQMASYCTPEVLRWAQAAGVVERQMTDLHARIATGWRREFPWSDNRTATPAPANADERWVEWQDGVRVWKYRGAFDHQKVMATVATELDGAAFLCGLGTGKTRAGSETIRAKVDAGLITYAVVICPRGVMKTWERELKAWTNGLHPVVLSGSVRDRKTILNAYTNGGIRARGTVFILNYDVLPDMQETLVALMDAHKTMILADEMHRVKNPNAQQTQAIMEIGRHAAHRLGMTATPIANGPQDVWSQWYFVDLGVTFGANFVQFRREYFNENPYTWSIDPVDGAISGIGQKMRLRGLRFRTEDCIDLPPKSYEVIEIDMTPEQLRAYREMEANLIAWLRGERATPPGALLPGDSDEDADAEDPVNPEDVREATAANQLVAILRLTQITSGFVNLEDGSTHFFQPNPKLRALEELVREQVADGKSVIVWAQYRNDINAICNALANLSPVRIDGSQTGTRGEREREDAERLFQSGERKVLVGQPGAGGVGLNLQAASVAIYYSQGYSLINREQSEGRCYRSGSDIHAHVTYFDMVANNSIDETIRAALADKKDIASAVVDLRQALGV